MPPTMVYLIGEEHVDLRKLERYQRAFRLLQPDVISTELNETLLDEIQQDLTRIVEQFQIPRNRVATVQELFLAGGYAAAEEYFRAKEKEPKIIYGDDLISPETQQAYYKLVTWEKLDEKPTFSDRIWFAALQQRLIARREKGNEYIDAQTYSLLDMLRQNDRREITRVTQTLDCLYLDEDDPEDDPNYLMFDLPQRNKATVEKLMRANGIVVHGGGSAHVFGEYTLYDMLQEKGIPVERFSLLDFACSSPKNSQRYKQKISELAEKYH